jgi:hypothetical protein
VIANKPDRWVGPLSALSEGVARSPRGRRGRARSVGVRIQAEIITAGVLKRPNFRTFSSPRHDAAIFRKRMNLLE